MDSEVFEKYKGKYIVVEVGNGGSSSSFYTGKVRRVKATFIELSPSGLLGPEEASNSSFNTDEDIESMTEEGTETVVGLERVLAVRVPSIERD